MARNMTHSLFVGKLEDTPYVGIARSLTDDAGNTTRAKGGIWVKLEGDTDAVLASLTEACAVALEFAAKCESLHAEIIAREKAPKAAKAPKAPKPPTPPAPAQITVRQLHPNTPAPVEPPKPPAAMCDAASHADNATAGAKFCPLCGKDLTTIVREKAVAQARASKPAPAPRVSNPAPAKKPAAPATTPSGGMSAADWANLVS